MSNFIFKTDSYKLNHWAQYPEDTTGVFSYLEARVGGLYPSTLFFGLEAILKKLEGVVVTYKDVHEANRLAAIHFGKDDAFNLDGWLDIVANHDGQLPVRIKAVPEGSVVPLGNVLMTVENTDPDAFWLTNALESMLLHVWYPTTVATLSYHVKQMMKQKLVATGCGDEGLPFMLHDFGYRGATGDEAAAIGGLAHLVNFMGTDTLPALLLAIEAYGAEGPVGFSVPATEHSVMTAKGRAGEYDQLVNFIDTNPDGIISCVADSYNIYQFVDWVCGWPTVKGKILARDGKFVVRPDSVTLEHTDPSSLMVYIAQRLWESYGGEINAAGFKVLDPHVGIIWGDGIDPYGIEKILDALQLHGFAASNAVFGMGGGLLQKVNRDTQKFAFKSSAQQRGGVWHDVFKDPIGNSKPSKPGRLKLVKRAPHGYATVREEAPGENLLVLRFEDGVIYNSPTFEDVRSRTA